MSTSSTNSSPDPELMPKPTTTFRTQKSSLSLTFQATGHPTLLPRGPTGTTDSPTRASDRKRKEESGREKVNRQKRRVELEDQLEQVNCCLRRLELQRDLLRTIALQDVKFRSKREKPKVDLDSLRSQSQTYRRTLSRERRLTEELAREKRPTRRRKKNRGQKRRGVPFEARKAKETYLEDTDRIRTKQFFNPPHTKKFGRVWTNGNSASSEIPYLRIPGGGTTDKRKHRKNQRIRV